MPEMQVVLPPRVLKRKPHLPVAFHRAMKSYSKLLVTPPNDGWNFVRSSLLMLTVTPTWVLNKKWQTEIDKKWWE
jgi:hypothetical protein